MASFTGKIPTPTDGFTLKVVYETGLDSSQDKVLVDTIGYVKRNNSAYYPSSSYATAKMTIDGSTKTLDGNVSYNLNTSDYDKIISYSKNVYLTDTGKEDGEKVSSRKFTIKLYFDGNRSEYYPKGSISKSITVTRDKYTVTYNANGGTGVPDNQTKYHGMSLTLKSTKPTRDGYTFVGWNTSSTATTSKYAAGATYSGNADATLYAIWKKSVTLTYDLNDGSGKTNIEKVTIYNSTTSASFTLPSEPLSRDGYEFLGWGTKSTSTTSSYSGGSKISLSSDTTLYGIWRKTVVLAYNTNKEDNNFIDFQEGYIYNTDTSCKFNILSTIPEYEGYSFLGWNTSSTDTTAKYSSGGTISISNDAILYAVWEACDYTVTLNANGGECSANALGLQYNSDKNSNISAYKPKYTGYEFLGWYSSPDGGTEVYDADGKCTNEGTYWRNDLCVCNGSYTVYAHWKLLNVAYIIKDNEPKLCYTYYKKDGKWHKAIMYQKINNDYKQSVI